jgi:protoporphyrinogen oxidase
MSGPHPEKPVVAILGAGCAGLAAGIRLTRSGYGVVVLEKEDHVGGLAGGVCIGGNTYEYGPHTFHTTDPAILGEITTLMGDELVPYTRTILIKFLGRYFKYPLAAVDVLGKLPPRTVLHAGLSFLWNSVLGIVRNPREENSETILKRTYGRVLYEIFFKAYITSVWGIPPAEFSPAFARERIPRLNVFDFLGRFGLKTRKRIGRTIKTDDYVEKVEGRLYTTRQGFSLIAQRMADEIVGRDGRIELNTEVIRLHRQGRVVRAIEGVQNGNFKKIECRAVINTLPINETFLMMQAPPAAEIISSARALRFRALVFVGLLVRRPRVLPASLTYYRQHSFNRISDLAQFGFHVVPEGSTMLVAEISCDVGDRAWNDDAFAKQSVLDDLAAEKLLAPGDVIATHVFRARHAYPIYTLNYERHLGVLLQAVADLANLETAGRQGRFQYINTHVAMKMGHEAADRLISKMDDWDMAEI